MKASKEVAFELKTILIPIVAISLKADFMPEVRKSRKYRQIAASIEHVGLIEPLIVSPVGDGTFLLLDGALRLDILKSARMRPSGASFRPMMRDIPTTSVSATYPTLASIT